MLFSDKVKEALKDVESYKDIFEFDYDIHKGEWDNIIRELISYLPIKTDWTDESIRARDFATKTISGSSDDYRYCKWEHHCNPHVHFKITIYSKSNGHTFKYFIVLEKFNYTDFKLDVQNHMTVYDLYKHFQLYKRVKEYEFFE